MSVESFKIDVEEEVLEDLKQRLANTRWPSPIEGAGWAYGADYDYLRRLCDYWRAEYDWRKWEEKLNAIPQFTSEIDGVTIRFWHVRAKNKKNAFPVLLLHGWPGSAFEFYDIIDLLTDPAAHGGEAGDALDVVVPDLPGYGWSGKPRVPGWGADRIAGAMNTLMTKELGYRRYGVQGGDWGGMIAARIGTVFPETAAAIHLNFTILPVPMIDELSEEDMEVCRRHQEFDFWEGAYHLVQETKCDAVTLAQTDSPAGLAAWIVEKFRVWSDCEGDLDRKYSMDQLITNLMFYWAPNSIASAARLYYESFHDPERNWGAPDPHIVVPAAAAHFPKDPFHRPKGWMEKHFNLVRWTEMPRGGHFAAMEEPELLAEDVLAFFREYGR